MEDAHESLPPHNALGPVRARHCRSRSCLGGFSMLKGCKSEEDRAIAQARYSNLLDAMYKSKPTEHSSDLLSCPTKRRQSSADIKALPKPFRRQPSSVPPNTKSRTPIECSDTPPLSKRARNHSHGQEERRQAPGDGTARTSRADDVGGAGKVARQLPVLVGRGA